ncbi:cysteine desulfurase, mitochondrial [Batrachochytrium dendrobatidis JEL423]|uniref:Cysteine desulfurase, mitochondrial n=1 Tax=Batrachochytrium dendrobatidis (strain JEL423) TaxID=403673 RepID=A0A177WW27_BATDL|nr:cysteine desulfurase, mitochondrial [Batrachochytrium dendrobatidis JEL423]
MAPKGLEHFMFADGLVFVLNHLFQVVAKNEVFVVELFPLLLLQVLAKHADSQSWKWSPTSKRIKKMSDRLINTLTSKIPNVIRNGDPDSTYPGCVNLSFAYVEGESLLMALKAIALSSGSACTSASLEPSYVLRALGADDEMAHSSIRFGIGRFTTDEEVDFAINEVLQHVERLREMSPLWEMVQEGVDLKSINWSQH